MLFARHRYAPESLTLAFAMLSADCRRDGRPVDFCSPQRFEQSVKQRTLSMTIILKVRSTSIARPSFSHTTLSASSPSPPALASHSSVTIVPVVVVVVVDG